LLDVLVFLPRIPLVFTFCVFLTNADYQPQPSFQNRSSYRIELRYLRSSAQICGKKLLKFVFIRAIRGQ